MQRPAEIGTPLDEVATPSLIIDLDAFERNVAYMRDFAAKSGMRLRAHAKTHKSADIARYQIEHGGACGICCQKLSEAEALAAEGIHDILISNQVVDPAKLDRLAQLAGKARIIVCIDDASVVPALSTAAGRHGTTVECLVEINCGANRCGVEPGDAAVTLADRIASAPGLVFAGLQSYQGSAQHIRDFGERRSAIEAAVEKTRMTIDMLKAHGLDCGIVGGAGSGTYYFESASGLYNEMQCGSYIFMDADYGRVQNADGGFISEFDNALFVLTSIMSKARSGFAVCDAGLKAHSIDSGPPRIHGRDDLECTSFSDEHSVIRDPDDTLKLHDRLKLIPGHCDPTCNLYDWYVGVRGGYVECHWPVTARGCLY